MAVLAQHGFRWSEGRDMLLCRETDEATAAHVNSKVAVAVSRYVLGPQQASRRIPSTSGIRLRTLGRYGTLRARKEPPVKMTRQLSIPMPFILAFL